MENSERVVDISTRIIYQVEGLSTNLRLAWSRTLEVIFSGALQKSHIQLIEGRSAMKRSSTDESIRTLTSPLTAEEKHKALALVFVLQSKASDAGDGVAARRMGEVTERWMELMGCSADRDVIVSLGKELEFKLDQFENRSVIKVKASIWPIALDFVVRFVIMRELMGYDVETIVLVNVFAVPLATFTILYITSARHLRYNQKLLLQYGGAEAFKVTNEFSPLQYTWLASFLGAGVFIFYILDIDNPEVGGLSILVLIALTVYYILCVRFFRVGRLSENDLAIQIAAMDKKKSRLNFDENDEVIVRLETDLNATTSRLEAYVLESALFGALSFSGFLQIVANKIITVGDMARFATESLRAVKALVLDLPAELTTALANLDSTENLFCLVSVESLLCSIFFLAVIASRLQFSDVADRVRQSLNLAKVFNEKEEVLLEHSRSDEQRLETLSAKINEYLEQAGRSMDDLGPVIQYMKYFRNAGIVVFLIILVSSSLLITGVLAWVFIVLAVATMIYFGRRAVRSQLDVIYLWTRIHFLGRGRWLVSGVLGLFVVGFALRLAFQWPGSDDMLGYAFLLIGLFSYVWIVFSSHFDPRFGEIVNTKGIPVEQSRWNITRIIFGASVVVACLGYATKMWRANGANEMLLLALTQLGLVAYVVGYFLCSKRILGLVAGFPLACTFIGILFKLLHLTGADEMLMIALVSLVIFFVLLRFLRNYVHKRLIQIFVVLGLLDLFYLFGGGIRSAYDLGTMVASKIKSYTEEVRAISIERYAPDVPNNLPGLANRVRQGVERFEVYHRQVLPVSYVTRPYELRIESDRDFVQVLIDSVKERPGRPLPSDVLEAGLLAARQMNAIAREYRFQVPGFDAIDFQMEGNFLASLNRTEEAIDALVRVGKDAPKEVADSIEKRILELQKTK